jgi:hypothetical protein
MRDLKSNSSSTAIASRSISRPSSFGGIACTEITVGRLPGRQTQRAKCFALKSRP